ncbi:MAG: glycosyltransferase [Vulcanimicrobiaceae bacterium]
MGSPRTLRVLHVVSRLAYYGAENVVRQLALAQGHTDMQTAVLTMYDSAVRSEPDLLLELPVRRRGRRDLTFMPRLIGTIRAFRPDLVHTHVHNGKYWGRAAAVAAGVRAIVHTEHNSDFHCGPIAGIGNRILHPLTHRVAVFTQTQATALLQAEPLRPEQLAIIPNGICPLTPATPSERTRVRGQLGLSPDDLVVFHVGRLAAVKNQALALRAFSLLVKSLPCARLVFLGDGSDGPALERERDALGMRASVAFLGFQSDVHTLLAAADALLLTSTNEAMPIAALEALFAGVPIVSTPWSGADDVLLGAAAIATGWSPIEVEQALFGILTDSARRIQLVERGLLLARERYGIDSAVRAYRDLYDDVLASIRERNGRKARA